MTEQIYQHQFMALPRDVRDRLRLIFNIPRTGIIEVVDKTVITDGTTNENMKVVTHEKLKEYIGSDEESYAKAWEIAVSKAEGELIEPIVIPEPETPVIATQEPTEEIKPITKTDGRKKSK